MSAGWRRRQWEAFPGTKSRQTGMQWDGWGGGRQGSQFGTVKNRDTGGRMGQVTPNWDAVG
jgi:hypothetical protein